MHAVRADGGCRLMMGEVVVLSQVPGQMIMAGGADGYVKIWKW